jgi:hypothetical protein
MRWYPWHWFSDLVFLGAGGFSAVYEAKVNLLYDVPERGNLFGSHSRSVALKIVDDKILNEVSCRQFLSVQNQGVLNI